MTPELPEPPAIISPGKPWTHKLSLKDVRMRRKYDSLLIQQAIVAFTDLFEQCAMTHRYGGEICNQAEADVAIRHAQAILERMKQEANQ